MKIIKLVIPTLVLSTVLVVAAFGSNGLKTLFNTRVNPVQADVQATGQPGQTTLTKTTISWDSQTVTAIGMVPDPKLPDRVPDAAGVLSGLDGSTLTLQAFTIISSTAPGNTASGEAVVVGTNPGDTTYAGVVIVAGSAAIPAKGDPNESGQTVTGSGSIELQGSAALSGQDLPTLTIPDGAPAGSEGGSTTFKVGPGLPAQVTTQKVLVTDATKIYQDVTPLSINEPSASGAQTIQQVLQPGSLDKLTAQSMVTVWGHKDGDQLIADVIVYADPVPLK